MSFLGALALPSPYHKKRSFLLQPKAFIGYFIFLIVLLYISHQIITVMPPSVLGYASDIKIPQLLTDTNRMREERGLSALKLNTTLSKASEAKAKDMFAKDYWAHNSPDGKEPWDFIVASGYDYLYAGENLAVDFSNSDGVVDAWYDSPSHRENLLNDKYIDVGFAVVNGNLQGRETTLVVQMFGYPRTRPARVSSAATSAPEDVIVTAPVNEVEEKKPEEEVPVQVIPPKIENPAVSTDNPRTGSVLNATDVFNVSRFIAIVLGLFITAMFAIDGYYIKQMGVFRISGHTILHVIMLLAAIAAIWYTQIGLVL